MKNLFSVLVLAIMSFFVTLQCKTSRGAQMNSNKESKAKTKTTNTEIALLSGGCFWGMEDIIRKIPGVLDTEVGYTGGEMENPTYQDVKTGETGHAEAVKIVFDPKILTYEELLGYFFRMHNPTTLNRQGNDVGSQYRSAIFFLNPKQESIALKVTKEVDKSKKWHGKIVTQIVPAGPFYSAEDYHQDYLLRNPGGYTCHFLRP